jgi:AraC family transcriptional regulator
VGREGDDRDRQPLAFLAVEAGFCDQSHFTRAFKRQFGVTPARFRALQL